MSKNETLFAGSILKLSLRSRSITFMLVLIAGLLMSALASFIPAGQQTVFAANNDLIECQKIIAAAQPGTKPTDWKRGNVFVDGCIKGYDVGYANPDNNDTSGACPTGIGPTSPYCVAGYKQGQADKKAESGNSASSASQIKTDAEKACQPYKDQSGISSQDKTDNFNGCVDGYVNQKKGQNATDACSSHSGSDQAACLAGYKNAANGTKVVPGQGVTVDPASSSTASTDGSSDNLSDPGLTCKVKFFNPLTWLLCPAVKGMVNIVNSLDDVITSQLSVGSPGNSDDPNQIFCDSASKSTLKDSNGNDVKSCDAYHTAWSSVRNIALGLMVLAGLIVLIAQAIGMEILDAYTVRKVLPRLVIAAIAITLSWQLMQFFVRFTNDLGFGVRWLIYQPFGGIHNATLQGGGLVATGLVGGVAILALGIFGLLSFAATAALAVFIAFIVLIIRQLLIIVLIIFAPIAIIAYVLPNTQNVYKLWWDSFAKALIMFPIIVAFIAAGRVFSLVANSGTTLGQLMGFAAYFAPYFLLPVAFRFAGGALRNIGGFVNDRSRGGFDRLKNYRGNKLQSNMQAMKEGNRYRASNIAARSFNRTTRGIAHAGTAGVTPWKMRSRFQAGMSAQKIGAMAEYMEKSQAWKAIQGNDDYLQATMRNMGGGDTEDDWRRYLSGHGYAGRSLEQGVAAIRAAKRDTNDEVFKASAVVANASTGTGWKEGGAGQMMESINEAAGGDRDLAARMLAETRSRATQARRIDLGGGGFGGQIGDLEKMAAGELTAQEATRLNASRVLEVNSAGAIASARGDSLKHLMPTMQNELRDAYASGNNVTIKRTLAKAANMYDTISQVSPENAELFADHVLAQPLNGAPLMVPKTNNRGAVETERDGTPVMIQALDAHNQPIFRTARTEIEQYRSDPEFRNMRKEWGAAEEQARRLQGGGPGEGDPGGLGGPDGPK